MMIFRVYPLYIVVFFAFFGVSLLLFAWFISSAIRQARKGTRKPHFFLRTVVALLAPITLMALTFFASLYLNTKRIEVDSHALRAYTLFDEKEVIWSDVASVDANFVFSSLLGMPGGDRSLYAWIDFRKSSGEMVHVSLRFMGDIWQLENFIRQQVPAFKP